MSKQVYGWAGRVGLIVPPANTTIEPEVASALPDGVSLHSTRLPGRVSVQTSIGLRERFMGYIQNLAQSSDSFGGAKLDALCLGVTGTCYLVGHKGEASLCASMSAGGVQNVGTLGGILSDLIGRIGAKRIALVVPYPAWLTELAVAYWQEMGLEVVKAEPVSDVISIYDIATDDIVAAARRVLSHHPDLILLSGTGAPTLEAISILSETIDIPVISSNQALAWWAIGAVQGRQKLEVTHPAMCALDRWIK
jgi:maleate isomerase